MGRIIVDDLPTGNVNRRRALVVEFYPVRNRIAVGNHLVDYNVLGVDLCRGNILRPLSELVGRKRPSHIVKARPGLTVIRMARPRVAVHFLTGSIVDRDTVISVETKIRSCGCNVVFAGRHFSSAWDHERLILCPVATIK